MPIEPGRRDGDLNRDIERAAADVGGHKSPYSDAYFERADFVRLNVGDTYRTLRERYDPEHRLLDLYAKVVASRSSLTTSGALTTPS